MTIWVWLLWMLGGMGIGLVLFFVGLAIFVTFRNAKERRQIKMLIKQGKMLEPIDSRDYDTNIWSNIKPDPAKIESLNYLLFKNKQKEDINGRYI